MTYRFDTLAIHAGQTPDPTTGAVMPAIQLSSTFAQNAPGQHKGFEYSRSGNPTRAVLEQCLAQLEGATYGLAFSSGCAAMTAVIHTLKQGDHVIAGDDLYGGSSRILRHVFGNMGIETTFVNMSQAEAVEGAFRPSTRLVWVETPTNPMLRIVDIENIAQITRRKSQGQALLAVDNTFATPYLQRPLQLGADLVMHSTTKYLNGHSDVVGGAVLTSNTELNQRIAYVQNAVGGVPSPFDCFLILRGLKTLHLRVERHCQSAAAIAEWLDRHPKVAKVHYPGLPTHPENALVQKQMKAAGGMISVELRADLEAARRFITSLNIFVCAESLGGVESLIEIPAAMTHAGLTPEARKQAGITDGLVRMSVGLEALEDLRDDLDQALSAL